jgi:hypothetical protein
MGKGSRARARKGFVVLSVRSLSDLLVLMKDEDVLGIDSMGC